MANATQASSRTNITIVIPSYRAEATIRRAIDSALAQAGVGVRVVVVIDGKLDRTAEAIAHYPPDQITVVEHAENKGAAVSRNAGLALVDTEYVMFLDADDFLEGPLLSGLVARMRSSGADVGFGPMQVLHEVDLGEGPFLERMVTLLRNQGSAKPRPVEVQHQGGGVRGPRFVPDFSSSEDIFRRWHLEGVFVTPCSVLWRTGFIRQIGGWDPELTRNDDGELVMRAVLKGAEFVLSDEGCGIYVRHSGETLSNRMDNLESMLRANEKLLAIESKSVSKALQHSVCAGHYFNIAWQGYYGGSDQVADEAIKRSRAMGFRLRGRLPHRIAFRLLGVKTTTRLIARLRRPARAAAAPASAAS
jgi:glycosyltransferase involved in cell wall biosynthesis